MPLLQPFFSHTSNLELDSEGSELEEESDMLGSDELDEDEELDEEGSSMGVSISVNDDELDDEEDDEISSMGVETSVPSGT